MCRPPLVPQLDWASLRGRADLPAGRGGAPHYFPLPGPRPFIQRLEEEREVEAEATRDRAEMTAEADRPGMGY